MGGQTRERERTTIDPKRARDALLKVPKSPPEVLDNIFYWNVCSKGDFDGLEEGSHNLLSVCRHWHEAALGTSEHWSFWGNTLADWARWSRRSGTAPLDLVLWERGFNSGPDHGESDASISNDGRSDDSGSGDESSDATLSDVLQDRASRDTVRRIHLRSEDPKLLRSIIYQLTPEEDRFTNVESFILNDEGDDPRVDITDFFARHRFPKLQNIELFNCTISS